MKDSAEHEASLKRLCNRVRREMGAPAVPELSDVVTELILGCLSESATEAKARSSLNRLRTGFVDFNELRVCRAEEIVEILGKGFGHGNATAKKIIAVLREVYDLRDSLDLTDLAEGGKREAKAFFESLENANPYIVSRVMLNSIDAHAFPVHEQMMKMLLDEEVINAKADAAEVQGFLERHISATAIRKTYFLLRKYADGHRGKRKTTKKAVKKTAKKTTKKKAKA